MKEQTVACQLLTVLWPVLGDQQTNSCFSWLTYLAETNEN